MRALIFGFLGRQNFGDELMAELHAEILREMGYEVKFTTDLMYHKNIPPDYNLNDSFIKNHGDYNFDLVIIGGGALPAHYGLEYCLRIKHSKLVMGTWQMLKKIKKNH